MAPAATGQLEATQVRGMFDRIAGIYDPLNTAMTAGLHHRWRARAADLARVGPGSRVLDVACGTGDLAIELAARVAPGGEVLGCDFSEAMLDRARAKARRRFGAGATGEVRAPQAAGADGTAGAGGVGAARAAGVELSFEWADALKLPYAEDSFDAATVGFGVRNFSDLARGLGELARVVRPGGRVVILEMTNPTKPPLSLFFGLWFDRVVPLLGRIAAPLQRGASAEDEHEGRGDGNGAQVGVADAYTYLPSSVRRFPSPEGLAGAMARAGLRDIVYVITAGGIIAIHAATVAPMRAA
jgi:demethylmenaquinone methyltransferase / 2-methoxy-6-polyprenyl-1,4-benzoquinol methylase